MMQAATRIVFRKGKLVYFRPLLKEDLRRAYLAWLNNPELVKYSGLRVWPTTENDLDDFFANLKSQNHVVFAACDLATDIHFGSFSLAEIDWVNRNAKAALMIGIPEFRSAHYLDGLGVLADYAFDTLNLNKIYGGTEIPAVPPLLKRLGWVVEGTLRSHNYRDGKYVDVVQFSLLADDHRALREE